MIQALPAEGTAVLCVSGRFYSALGSVGPRVPAVTALQWGGLGAFIDFSKLQLFPGSFTTVYAMLFVTETGCKLVVNGIQTRKEHCYGSPTAI